MPRDAPPDRQIHELRRAFDRDPKSTVFAELAEALTGAGRVEEALEVCRRGLLSNPEHIRGRLALVTSYRELGQYRDARTELHRVVKLDPGNARAYRLLGEVLLTLGDEERAAVALQKAVDLAPEDGIAMHLLRRLHGDPDHLSAMEDTAATREFDLRDVPGARVAKPMDPVDAAALTKSAVDRIDDRQAPAVIPESFAADASRTDVNVALLETAEEKADRSTRVVVLPRMLSHGEMRPDTEEEEDPDTISTPGIRAPAAGAPVERPGAEPARRPSADRQTEKVPALRRPGRAGPIGAESGSEMELDPDGTPTDMDPEVRMRRLGELWRAKLRSDSRPHTTSVSVSASPGAPRRESTEALAFPPGKHAPIGGEDVGVRHPAGDERQAGVVPPEHNEDETTAPSLPETFLYGGSQEPGVVESAMLHMARAALEWDRSEPAGAPEDAADQPTSKLGPLPAGGASAPEPEPRGFDAPPSPYAEAEPPTAELEPAVSGEQVDGNEWAPDEPYPYEDPLEDPPPASPGKGLVGGPVSDDHVAADIFDGFSVADPGATVSLRPPDAAELVVPTADLAAAQEEPTADEYFSSGGLNVTALSAPESDSDMVLLSQGRRTRPYAESHAADRTTPEIPSSMLDDDEITGDDGEITYDGDDDGETTSRWSKSDDEPGDDDHLSQLLDTLEREPSPSAARPVLEDDLAGLVRLPEYEAQQRAYSPPDVGHADEPGFIPGRGEPFDPVRSTGAQARGDVAAGGVPGFRWSVVVAFGIAGALVVTAATILIVRQRAVARDEKVRDALEQAREAAAADTWAGYVEALEHMEGLAGEVEEHPEIVAREAFLHAMMWAQFGPKAVPAGRIEDTLARLFEGVRTTADAVFARAVAKATAGTPASMEAALLDVDAATDAYSDEPALAYLRGWLLLRIDKPRAASEALQEALLADAAYVPALVALGRLAALAGNDAQAETFFNEAITSSRHHAGAIIGRFRVLEARGSDTTSAAADLAALLSREEGLATSDRAWGELCLARYHRRAGEQNELDEMLAKITEVPLPDVAYLRELASLMFVLGRHGDADRFLDGALALDVTEALRAPLIHVKSLVAIARGDGKAAAALLASLADEREPVGRYLRGRAALLLGDAAAAAADLGEAAKADPSLIIANVFRARALMSLSRPKEAIEILEPLARDGARPGDRTDPALAPVRYLPLGALLAVLGHAQRKVRRFKSARATLRAALDEDPSNAEALFDLAMLHDKVAETAKKEELFGKILTLDPTHAAAKHELGMLLAHQGRYSEALARLSTKEEREGAKVIAALLEAALADRDLEGAELHLKELRGAGASVPRLQLWQARVALLAGRNGEARRLANDALRKVPRSAGLRTVLGDVFLMTGDPRSARKEFERALTFDSRYVLAHVGLGEAWFGLGDTARAMRAFRAATATARLRVMPRGHIGRAYLGLALTLAQRGETARALEHAGKATELMPTSKKALVVHADLAAGMERVDLARASYARAIELDADDAELHFRYGALLKALGDREDAVRELRTYLETAPDGKNRANAARLLDSLEGK